MRAFQQPMNRATNPNDVKRSVPGAGVELVEDELAASIEPAEMRTVDNIIRMAKAPLT